MNDYEIRYVELKKAYEHSGGAAEQVLALYEYKDFLEEQDTPEARWVLADVYETLELYRSAYETLLPLVSRTDKKALKRLGKLQGLQGQWNAFALRRPGGGKEPKRHCSDVCIAENICCGVTVTEPFVSDTNVFE